MSNQPPQEITTPPEGYEWTGEVRIPEDGEPHAEWSPTTGRWRVEMRTGWKWPEAILRKVKSPTVMIEVERAWFDGRPLSATPIREAFRKALEREND